MGYHENQFAEHAAHQTLDQLQAAVEQDFKHKLDEDGLSHLDRIRQATAFIAGRFRHANPVLNSAARLNPINKSLQASLNEINQFASNGSAGHLANAANQLDAGINNAAGMVSMPNAPESVTAEDAISFKSLAEGAIEELRREKEGLTAENQKLSERLDEQIKSLDEANKKLAALEHETAQKLDEFGTEFSKAESQRTETFDEHLQAHETKHQDTVAKAKTESNELIDAIRADRDHAKEILGIVSNIGLTGNFKGAGNEARDAANLFRWIALGCFGVLVGLILWTAFAGLSNGFDPWAAFFRLTAAAILIVPATYSARESSKHRDMEIRHRRAELELASIDAYLDGLDKGKRDEIKASLATRFFGNAEPASDKSTTASAGSLLKELRHVIDLLAKK